MQNRLGTDRQDSSKIFREFELQKDKKNNLVRGKIVFVKSLYTKSESSTDKMAYSWRG